MEIGTTGPADHVELIRLRSRQEAEGLQFTLTSVGIRARIGSFFISNGERIMLWRVTVPQGQFAEAERILEEEEVPDAEQAARAEAPPAPPSRLHWVVGLAVANLLVWLAMEGSGGSENTGTLLRFGSTKAALVFEGEWWRMVTAMFIHIGPKHLMANMFTLLILGPPVLRAWGVGRFYFMYVMAGIIGNWVSFGLSPSLALKAGASGAILGLLGVLAGTRIRQIRSRAPAAPPSRFKTWHIVAMVIAYYGFVVGVGATSDHLAHVGGLVAGGAAALMMPLPGSPAPPKERFLEWTLGVVSMLLVVVSGLLQWQLGG